ncbi:MAG: carboxylesterase/lipase family protein [Desulfobacterales bacterium]|nr:carboxylesterase/lipase family protein [Desulfobacterales bacterium]MBF0396510.1 carboxylesterase/lipase family protein [Desulfobacterales bacterium]
MKYIRLIVTLAALAFLSVQLTSCSEKAPPFNPQPERSQKFVVVQTTHGQVAGFEAENGLNVFLGIPYAEPPVGRLRFTPPQPIAKWRYVRPAYRFGPTCPQGLDEFEPASLLYQDEDCLSLNIWTPGIDKQKRPVMIFIHGGGFIQGGTGDPLYDGAQLAKRGDIIVASLNYRVAALGFLFLDNYGQEFKGSGNIALQDQIAGLKWIKNNISQFGGDPDNITIVGESAGSVSVMFLMISPMSKGLFHKAIGQSGAINLARTKEQATIYTQRFMKFAGVKDVNGLRSLSTPRIVEIEEKLIKDAGFEADLLFAPVMDDIVIPANPVKAFEEGAASGIPLLNGTNYDEYRYWLLYFPSLKYIPTSFLLPFAPEIRDKLGNKRETVIAHYNKVLQKPGLSGVTFALVNDMLFRIPHINVSDMQSRHAPVWMYRFDWKSKVSDDLGACHAIELPFVFRTFNSPTSYQIVGSNPPIELSNTMMDVWIAFIRTGNPNIRGMQEWPVYNTQRRGTMIFNEKCVVQDDPDKSGYLLYKGILY